MIEGVTVDYGGASVGYGARQKGSEEVNCRSSSIRRAAAEASHHIPNIQYRHRPTVVPTVTSLFQMGAVLLEPRASLIFSVILPDNDPSVCD